MIKSIPHFLPSNSSPSPNTHFPCQIHVLFALSPLNLPISACTCMGIDSSSGSWAAQGLQPWRDLTPIPPSAISSQSLLSWCWNLMTTHPHACQDLTWLISCMQSVPALWADVCNGPAMSKEHCLVAIKHYLWLLQVFYIFHDDLWVLEWGVCICLKSVMWSYIYLIWILHKLNQIFYSVDKAYSSQANKWLI